LQYFAIGTVNICKILQNARNIEQIIGCRGRESAKVRDKLRFTAKKELPLSQQFI